MKKLIIEIPCEAQLEEQDIDNMLNFSPKCSLFVEIGKPHRLPDMYEAGIAEIFAIDITDFSVRIEES